jgi:UDPglucose--hexose-1-phosphate uridylyltransferase
MEMLRQNFATKEWVVIAAVRARRPEDMVRHHVRKSLHQVATCPFCPENETLTPADVMRVPASDNMPWHVRVVPNKFAALCRDAEPAHTKDGSRRLVNGFGVYDVIVEMISLQMRGCFGHLLRHFDHYGGGVLAQGGCGEHAGGGCGDVAS